MNLEALRPRLAVVASGLERLGLAMPAFRLFEWLQSLGAPREPGLPPAYYRVLTNGIADQEAYVAVGRRAGEQFVRLAEDAGLVLDAGCRVLEFGSGCGRVSRVVAALRPVALHGCELHRGMVRWCRRNIPGAYAVSRTRPPLSYADGAFDLVYALSVFTHMSRPNVEAWARELARVTRPGGVAIFSFLDEHSPAAAPFLDPLRRDGFYLKRAGTEGSNLMVCFFTHQGFAERLGPHWTKASSVASIDSPSHQAMMVFRRA